MKIDNRMDVCANCGTGLQPDDKYCRYCGAKRGAKRFIPRNNMVELIYGPMRVFRCRQCGYSWQGMKGAKCPKCGGELDRIMG